MSEYKLIYFNIQFVSYMDLTEFRLVMNYKKICEQNKIAFNFTGNK